MRVINFLTGVLVAVTCRAVPVIHQDALDLVHFCNELQQTLVANPGCRSGPLPIVSEPVEEPVAEPVQQQPVQEPGACVVRNSTVFEAVYLNQNLTLQCRCDIDDLTDETVCRCLVRPKESGVQLRGFGDWFSGAAKSIQRAAEAAAREVQRAAEAAARVAEAAAKKVAAETKKAAEAAAKVAEAAAKAIEDQAKKVAAETKKAAEEALRVAKIAADKAAKVVEDAANEVARVAEIAFQETKKVLSGIGKEACLQVCNCLVGASIQSVDDLLPTSGKNVCAFSRKVAAFGNSFEDLVTKPAADNACIAVVTAIPLTKGLGLLSSIGKSAFTAVTTGCENCPVVDGENDECAKTVLSEYKKAPYKACNFCG